MPNWCKGTLRIRGKGEDIIAFLSNEIVKVENSVLKTEKGHELVQKMTSCKDIEGIYTKYDTSQNFEFDGCERGYMTNLWVKDSRRLFISGGAAYIDNDVINEIISIAIDVEQAWNMSAEFYAQKAKKYNLEMSIMAFERGMEFVQDISVKNGEVLKDNVITYDDWAFECPCPLLGG
jgi:exonuclease VII small subunit